MRKMRDALQERMRESDRREAARPRRLSEAQWERIGWNAAIAAGAIVLAGVAYLAWWAFGFVSWQVATGIAIGAGIAAIPFGGIGFGLLAMVAGGLFLGPLGVLAGAVVMLALALRR